MKQVSQNYRTGRIRLEAVQPPALRPGGILVRTHYSAVSVGTEGMKAREGKLSYLGKARARPDQVKKVLQSLRQQGLRATYRKVMNRLGALTPLGYSLAGEVVAVGPGADEFFKGQRVACAGAGYANHAELNFVPKNLAVPVPAGVSLKHAAFGTVGAIALHGFRQAGVQLGEVSCVIGLGLLGQLLVQILHAAGVRVIGVDLDEPRCRLAVQLGAEAAFVPGDPQLDHAVSRATRGAGVDAVFIAAGGASNAPVELAGQLARDRARIVDIGKTRLDVPWNDWYLKELGLVLSRSYGPGRYDPSYEERGIDYPIGYVRWTERRNIAAFLDLVAAGKVKLDPLISTVRRLAEAQQVYEEMATGRTNALGILFEYHAQEALPPADIHVPRTAGRAAKGERVGLAVVGAGSYASSMLLPHLARNPHVSLVAVATTSSLSAENARRKFAFAEATTDYRGLLERDDIDAVIIATRHASHAKLVCEFLRAGKATYVEKPLALDVVELESVRRAILESGNGRLMVGFNRRFAPLIRSIAEAFRRCPAPLVAHYRVHAGQIEKGSWYLDASEGSRFIGESGHFFDVLSYLTGSPPVSVGAISLRPEKATPDDVENLAVSVEYGNGSVGNLLYLTQGGGKLPKEHLELHGAGQTAVLENFESLSFFGKSEHRVLRAGRRDKGQEHELAAFIHSVKTGGEMPIDVPSLLETSLTAFAARQSMREGRRIRLSEFWQHED